MSQNSCSCAAFARLEGASVPAYIKVFLDDLGRTDATRKDQYRCRVCGRLWEKHAPDPRARNARPTLVRVDAG